MTTAEAFTCQDWYRVRRGEDEIAWGKTRTDPQLPLVLFSRRSSQELAFLEPEQSKNVLDCIRRLSTPPQPESGIAVLNGRGRRMLHIGPLRIVFRYSTVAKQIEISTIRGGKVCDPENVGPSPARNRL